MNSKTIRTLIIVGVLLITFLWIKGSYNTLVDNDEKLTTSWNNVEVAYQNRADKKNFLHIFFANLMYFRPRDIKNYSTV